MLFARNATNFSRSAAHPLIAHSMFSPMQVSNLGESWLCFFRLGLSLSTGRFGAGSMLEVTFKRARGVAEQRRFLSQEFLGLFSVPAPSDLSIGSDQG